MSKITSEWIRPLKFAENQFLQVLIDQFELLRKNTGVELKIQFSDQTPAIWNREAKYDILAHIGKDFDKKSQKYQNELDSFLIEGTGQTYEYRNERFAFRYSSGGVLPVI